MLSKRVKKLAKKQNKALKWHKRHFPVGSLVSWTQTVCLSRTQTADITRCGLVLDYDTSYTLDNIILKLKIQTSTGVEFLKVENNFYRSVIKCLQI
jgi:hypothetical protein